jgi:CubicO group peptidase (beta-lactamase class C family)
VSLCDSSFFLSVIKKMKNLHRERREDTEDHRDNNLNRFSMKKTIFLNLLALIIISVSSCTDSKVLEVGSPASEKFSEERLARIDKMIQGYIDSSWIAGATGFIARDGKIVYNRSFGIKDPETKTPLKSDDIFRIASQTKAITSIAAMMLFEEGKFLLDDPVSKYIPEFRNPQVLDKFNEKDTTYTTVPANREIRIRDLFTHTSGIDYAGIGSPVMRAIYAHAGIPGGFGDDKIMLGDKMRALGKLPLLHQPGERFTYGLNVDVLGYLIEVLSGESLDKFFQKHIFEPLGMNDTYFYIPASKSERLVAVNREDGNHHVTKMPQDRVNYPLLNGTYFSGGAGLSSTTKDYATFLQMLVNKGEYNGKRLLARRTVELITCNQIGDLNVGRDKFGLGFQITTAEGQAQLGISKGSFAWGGYFGTTYWADPEERLVCLLFIQQSPLSHGDIQSKFKAMVYQALTD